MFRVSPVSLVLGVCLLLVVPASGALLEDTFGGTGDLDPAVWTATESSAAVDVGRVGGVARMGLTDACAKNDYGQAMSVGSWAPPAVDGLAWAADFRKAGAGADKPMLEPFRFESPAGGLSLRLVYGSTAATLYVFRADGFIGTTVALRDPSDNLFEPTSANTWWQHVAVGLTAYDVSVTLTGTADGQTYGPYTATVTGYTDYFDLGQGRAGHFGLRTEAKVQGGVAQAGEFDNVTLVPEPATVALVAAGLLWRLTRRRGV